MRHACLVAGLAGAISIGALGGCEKAAKGEEKVKTVVLDEGVEPKFQLRYAIPEGSKQTLDMVMDMTMAMSGAGMPGGDMVLPRMIMETDIEIPKVGKDGAMEMVMTTTDITIEDRPGSMPGVIDAMQAEIDGMKGMKMTATLMPNGQTRNMKVDESSVSAKMREQVKQTEQMVDQMTTILPDIPVGVGARWRVDQTVRQQGMRMNVSGTYELLEVSEGHAVIKADIQLSAPAQTIEQNGIEVKLEHMAGSGGATNTLDFKKMVEDVEASIDMDMRMSAMGQSMSITIGLDMQMVPKGKQIKPAKVEGYE
jgi:hypothetical protein